MYQLYPKPSEPHPELAGPVWPALFIALILFQSALGFNLGIRNIANGYVALGIFRVLIGCQAMVAAWSLFKRRKYGIYLTNVVIAYWIASALGRIDLSSKNFLPNALTVLICGCSMYFFQKRSGEFK